MSHWLLINLVFFTILGFLYANHRSSIVEQAKTVGFGIFLLGLNFVMSQFKGSDFMENLKLQAFNKSSMHITLALGAMLGGTFSFIHSSIVKLISKSHNKRF